MFWFKDKFTNHSYTLYSPSYFEIDSCRNSTTHLSSCLLTYLLLLYIPTVCFYGTRTNHIQFQVIKCVITALLICSHCHQRNALFQVVRIIQSQLCQKMKTSWYATLWLTRKLKPTEQVFNISISLDPTHNITLIWHIYKLGPYA